MTDEDISECFDRTVEDEDISESIDRTVEDTVT